MARERDRADWWKHATGLAHITRAINGEQIDPMDLMPEELRWTVPEKVKTPEQEQRETRCALTLIGQALGDV